MKILFITTTEVDYSSGGAIRSGGIRDALRKVGEVHTLIFTWSESEFHDANWREGDIRYAGYSLHGWFSPEALRQRARLRRWIRGILGETAYDVIVARFVSTAYLIPRPLWSRLVIDADDAVRSLSGATPVSLQRRALLALRNILTTKTVGSAAHVWYPNPSDGPKLAGQRKSLLRNTIRLPPVDRSRGAAVRGRILMVGLMTHGPNIEGMRWFVDHVLPRLVAPNPGVEVHVVGKYRAEDWTWLQDHRVKFRGFVPDLAVEYDQASLVIAPILNGGGTQIKVIDALAHGRPLVVSAFAHAGFVHDFHHGAHLLVAADAEEWIRHCNWTLHETRAAEEMATRGQMVAAAYGSATMDRVVRETLNSVAAGIGELHV